MNFDDSTTHKTHVLFNLNYFLDCVLTVIQKERDVEIMHISLSMIYSK